MNINRNSWHYKVYNWTYDNFLNVGKAPLQTNLCQYVQRIIWGTLWWSFLHIAATAIIIVMAPTMTIAYYVGGFFALFVGWRPISIVEFIVDGPSDFVRYDGLQIGRRFQLFPGHILALAGLVLSEYELWHHYPHGCLIGHLIGLGVMICLGLLAWWVTAPKELDILHAYIFAKKQRFCPLIEFTETPTDTKE